MSHFYKEVLQEVRYKTEEEEHYKLNFSNYVILTSTIFTKLYYKNFLFLQVFRSREEKSNSIP